MNFDALKRFLDYCLPTLSIPGSDTVIHKDGVEIFRYQSGYDNVREGTPTRSDALYNMYSITKVSTAVAAAQLIERGEISINDPVSAYLPEYRHLFVRKSTENGEEITEAKGPMLVKHLLTMTSGLDYNLSRPALVEAIRKNPKAPTLEIVRALAKDPLSFEPGEDYQYGLSLDVMGGIIELVSGEKLSSYMRRNIFEPLGMYNTSFGYTEAKGERMATQYEYDEARKTCVEIPKSRIGSALGEEYESAGGGLISSVDDQILLADALTGLGVGKNGNRILSSYAVNLIRTNFLNEKQLKSLHKTPQCQGYGYGIGMRVNLYPEMSGNIMPKNSFEWDGLRLSYLSASPETGISIFHAEHMGYHHATVLPRLRNVIYACLDY